MAENRITPAQSCSAARRIRLPEEADAGIPSAGTAGTHEILHIDSRRVAILRWNQ
jgi:hypothetical protein